MFEIIKNFIYFCKILSKMELTLDLNKPENLFVS